MKFFRLLKYEFLENIASIAIINVALLALLYIMGNSLNSENPHWIGAITIVPVAILASSIFLLNIIIRTLYARLFSQEGYLTLSLPISIDAILISKILISMLWVMISVFVIWLGIVVTFEGTGIFLHQRHLFMNGLLDMGRFVLFLSDLTLNLALKPIVLLLLVLAILHIGKINRFRPIAGIIIFMVVLFVENILVDYLFVLVDNIFGLSLNPASWQESIFLERGALPIALCFIISALPALVYYWCSRYLIKNKLEI